MEAFATKEQYEARYGAVADAGLLDECLDDATAAICAALDERGVAYDDPDEDFADRLMRVCRSVANRLMPTQTSAPAGATRYTQTAGPYSETWNLTTGYGTPKLVDSELSMLGLGGSRIGWARLGGGDG